MTSLSPPRHGLRLLGLGVGLAVALAACDQAATPTPATPTQPVEPANPGMLVEISYDQTTTTTTKHWPSGIADGLKSSDGELLESFEAVQEALAFDEDGQFYRQVEYLEGDQTTWLPEAAHEEFDLPSAGDNVPRIKRYETTPDGVMRGLSEAGEIVFETQLDPEAINMPQELLDAIMAALEDSSDVETRIAQRREQLTAAGVSFREVGGGRAEIRGSEDEEGYRHDVLLNLAIGLPEVVRTVRPDGRVEAVHLSTYQLFGNAPLATRETTYTYGQTSGGWGIRSRTDVARTNVSVRL